MKIESLRVINIMEVKQPLFPYVKPTDYYIDFIGDESPTDAAMINKIYTLEMKSGDIISYYNTTEIVADFIKAIESKIIGLDLEDISMAWDYMYRYTLPVGRGGIAMHAISAINLLMYDIYAKSLGIPVYRLIGGKTRKKIVAYASHLHPTDVKNLQDEAISYVNEGYKTMKMRFLYGPSKIDGVEKNIELVKIIRDAVGYNVSLACDSWMSWNYNFALKMAQSLEKYEIAWMEEPFLPDDFESMKLLSKKTDIPISEGEHHYYIYDVKHLLDAGIRIIQCDTVWAGGITAMKKIAALAEAYGAVVIPHTGNVYNLHFIASEPESITPMAEFLTKYREWMEQNISGIPFPKNGYFELNEKAGFGIEYLPKNQVKYGKSKENKS
ncbi:MULTISPECIES: enolase C-terminal domain-like protein [Acidiplasma]|jgi:L-alanine-DL-glutamate epimerase-like enolase superfamily enzyme|uniref:enolase C-terminal domain-like protein n=1 Tax=Acidiplasma TaxID=507753 RepID=UPI00064F9DA7|nr:MULTISPECIES: enolase C-terminal domain-like protein [unclassified Acidiplasma]WMT55056.1 MAG: enolase C-terminal domain-like protein [Acidiplasma sp.]